MSEQTAKQLHKEAESPRKVSWVQKAAAAVWHWFIEQNDKLEAEQAELMEMRLQKIRAEEEAIERYGDIKFAEDGQEEPEPDVRLFDVLDRIRSFLRKQSERYWDKQRVYAKGTAADSKERKRIAKHEARVEKRLLRLAERARAEGEPAETLFERLPKPVQAFYLRAEDGTMDRVEAFEGRVAANAKAAKAKAAKRWKAGTSWVRESAVGTVSYWKSHKVGILLGAGLLTVVFSLGAVGISRNLYYTYSYHGKPLGTVAARSDVYRILDIITDKMTALYGTEVTMDRNKDFSFDQFWSTSETGDTPDQILDKLSYLHDVSAAGYAIVADGEELAVLETEAEAEAVLEQVQDAYKESAITYTTTGFVQNVSIERTITSMNAFSTAEEAIEKIMSPGEAVRTYTVAGGDTLASIAKRTGVSMAELRARNEAVDTERLKIGQELILEREGALLTVRSQSIETYEEDIPFETVYMEDASRYQGDSALKKAGKNGSRKVTASVVRENGQVVETKALYTEILTEPVTQEVARGTKEIPARIGTGSFIWPTKGRISSKYGMRWGRLHKGLDITNSMGTPIYAADGGEVIFAGWESSYGYIVRISHGGNVVTCYAHCRKILVSVGEMVYQGQTIAEMGSTGNSTGPHVHFEVRINNVAKDPLNYLP